MPPKSGRRPRSAAQLEATRAKIVGCALTLFQEEGFASVSIRRLAKEVGCAPMTIYAHFEGKIDILRYLWAVVLSAVSDQIQKDIKAVEIPVEQLNIASQTFVKYWLDHPDHFRLVFMSGDITRPDVSAFILDETTLAHFEFFQTLLAAALPASDDVKLKTDTLINSLIGIAFCANTIRDYPWSSEKHMVNIVVSGLIAT